MIGRDAEDVLNRAVRFAFERKHEYFTLEHVLLSLLEETEILECIQACGGSYTDVKKELEAYLDKEVPQSVRNQNAKALGGGTSRRFPGFSGFKKKKAAQPPDSDAVSKPPKSGLPGASEDESDEEGFMEHPVATLSIQRMIQRALFQVQSAGKDEISPTDLFVAMFQSKDSYALHLLNKQGIKRLDVVNYVSHGAEPDEEVLDPETKNGQPGAGKDSVRAEIRAQAKAKAARSALDQYTTDLNQLARDGKLDPLVGRENELERVIQVLCRRQKNNPLLVGEAGVGKTAIAEGLALKVESKEVPPILSNLVVYALDLGSMLAGAKFRGDFEARFKKVLNALKTQREQGKRPVLLIDEIHILIGAGAVTGSVMDAANLIKPLLSRGELQCIGSTTYKEFRGTFEKDTALARRFQKVEVPEPSRDEAVQILQGLKPGFEEHHDVTYTPEALRSAVELSSKHLTDRFLPDKAIDVIDEVGARSRVWRQESEDPVAIGEKQVEDMVAKIARIPARTVSTSQKTRLQNLERDLKLTIFGQDGAIGAMVTSIQLARSGLRTGERPVGCFLFCGPTGVGKTELAKQLAHSLGVPFLRYDMSEYMEKHTVSRLIGAPPGYVGFDQAGLLTDSVLKNPHSVVLLDEFEKAHFDVWNILLQVMDNGMLTDNNGRKVDFRNTILIMTSNVGSREHERGSIGERLSGRSAEQVRSSVSKQEVERTFSPEFRNRLDSVVYFNALDPVTIGQVVGKQLMELEGQLLAKKVEIEVDADVREWLAKHGYDRKLGARPMARLIQDRIKKPLAEEILFGKLEKGGKCRISLKDGSRGIKEELCFKYEARVTGSESEAESQSVSSETPGEES